MRICLVSVEIFAWGKHGGFGKATRTIGRELVRRGHEVFAVVPRRPGQRPVETLDGITVLGFHPLRPWEASPLLAGTGADVFHSCEPSTATWLAVRAMPSRRHVVTVRDPRDARDWALEFARPSLSRIQVLHNWLYENNPFVRRSVRRADAVFATARSLAPKIRRIYGLPAEPAFMPTPVDIPPPSAKSALPTVCYVARLDRRKRPELFLALAPRFPGVRFVLMGKSRDAAYEASLRRLAAGSPNVEFSGFVDPFGSGDHARLLGESRVAVNTATREGLPNAFLEAAANGCAILSAVDPDRFASRFGFHAKDGDFAKGLAHLLADDRWKVLGEAGRRHVEETFSLEHAVDLHEAAYREVTAS